MTRIPTWWLPALVLVLPMTAGAQTEPSNPAPTASATAKPQSPAQAAQRTAAPQASAAQAERVLDILKDEKKRADLVSTLEAIAQALPEAKPTPDANSLPIPLAPNSLGAQVVQSAHFWSGRLFDQLLAGVRAFQSLPQLGEWVVSIFNDQLTRETLLDAAWRLSAVFGSALSVEWFVLRMVSGPRRWLGGTTIRDPPDLAGEAREEDARSEEAPERDLNSGFPAERGLDQAERDGSGPPGRSFAVSAQLLSRRLPPALGVLLLDLCHIAAFAFVAYPIVGSEVGGSDLIRLVLTNAVDAYIACAFLLSLARLFLSPDVAPLRLVRLSDSDAAYCLRWLRRIIYLDMFGSAAAGSGLLLGMGLLAHDGLLKAVFFFVHLMICIVMLQKRRAVAGWLRPRPDATGFGPAVRRRLAGTWHWIAIFYVIALWVVWAVEIPDGYDRLLQLFLYSTGIVLAARLVSFVALGAVDRVLDAGPEIVGRAPWLDERGQLYRAVLRSIVATVITAGAFLGLLELLGLPAAHWLTGTAVGLSLMSSLGTIGVTVLIAFVVWESVNIAIQAHLAKLTQRAEAAKSARLRTLLPLLRTLLSGAIIVVTGLTVLSQIGVNIAPLLAGAGILGVAIGFGSQKLVQDLINGIFLLLENAMQVGDFVTVAGVSGTVENLSVRTIRLRASDGSVHIIPFSSVTTVNNSNRGLGNAAVTVSVAFAEDTDRVCEELRQIASDMRREPDFLARVMGDLVLFGVDRFDGASVTIAGQIPCTDTGRWVVQREFNRRLKQRFQELGIRLYNPSAQYLLEAARPAPLSGANEPRASEMVRMQLPATKAVNQS